MSTPWFFPWWDDALDQANRLAAETRLRHKVAVVRHYVEGTQVVLGWRVDLADGEHTRAAAAAALDAEFWAIVTDEHQTRRPLPTKTIADACSPEATP